MSYENKRIWLRGESVEEIFSLDGGEGTGIVFFDVQPNVGESGTTEYVNIDSIRQPGTLSIYMGSPGRNFSISAKFVSRTVEEATKNLGYVRTLRSWRMPEKDGDGGFAKSAPSRLKLGGLGQWYNSIPVRMVSLNIENNDDSDYIRAGNSYVPIFWNISMDLKEVRSVDELENFNIADFRAGTLRGW